MNTKPIYNTILSSTKSGHNGFYGIGEEFESSGGVKYTIRSAFQPTFPNGAKPILLVCTYEFAKKPTQKTKFAFVIMHKYPNGEYYTYGNITGITLYCTAAGDGEFGYELKTNTGKYQIVHDFWFQHKHCFVAVPKHKYRGWLEVFWHNPENDKYYKIMFKE